MYATETLRADYCNTGCESPEPHFRTVNILNICGRFRGQERKIAEVFRHRHAFGQLYKGYDFLLRKTCQSLVTEDFISSLKWMLVGEDDIVYIRPDHGGFF